jgi:hypothetical protein
MWDSPERLQARIWCSDVREWISRPLAVPYFALIELASILRRDEEHPVVDVTTRSVQFDRRIKKPGAKRNQLDE